MNSDSSTVKFLWKEKGLLPEPAAGGASAVSGKTLLVAGGTNWKDSTKCWLDRVDLYDLESGQWRNGPQLPRAFAYGCFATTPNGLEIIGGCDATGVYRDSWQLQPGALAWSTLEDAPEDFIYAVAESWNKGLYIFGGCSSDQDLTTAKNVVWVRDSSYTWRPISTLPQGNILLCAHAHISGVIYFFGGCTASSGGGVVNHDDVFSFDCATHTWTRRHPLPTCIRGATAVPLDNHRIAVFGGYAETFLDSILIYDLEKDCFQEGSPLPVGLLGTQFIKYQGTIYGVGGEDRVRSRYSRLLAATFS